MGILGLLETKRIRQELAEERAARAAMSVLLWSQQQAMQEFGIIGGPDLEDATRIARRMEQDLGEAYEVLLALVEPAATLSERAFIEVNRYGPVIQKARDWLQQRAHQY